MATDNKKFVVKNGLAVGNGATGPIGVIDEQGVWIGATGTLHGATGPQGATGIVGLTGATGPSGDSSTGGTDPILAAIVFGSAGAGDSAEGGGAVGGGADKIFYENDTVVSTNYTITANKNAMTAGPVTINNDVLVTILSGSVWTVV